MGFGLGSALALFKFQFQATWGKEKKVTVSLRDEFDQKGRVHLSVSPSLCPFVSLSVCVCVSVSIAVFVFVPASVTLGQSFT